ncbi:nlp-11 [Pristionchus pacificus]|uniref:Nlp-11 n=1 Tax=Pristionchus pacificus TaxID=54126 RepID=A0A454XTQ2_PRIPA|nr:nlp-11 [Pristionchus pacificus]|eukprot:PDM62182.1 nlp-11 [Pristionchus pacificus]
MSSELGSLSRLAIFAAVAACMLSAVTEAAPRAKRQISPAQQLQEYLDLYAYPQPGVKRSADHKRHLAPSSEIFAEVPHNLRELAVVGKRSASPADEFQQMGNVYARLYDAGRKRGSISPAADLEQQIEMKNFFDVAGRR